MESQKERLGVEDWSINSTSLDETFMSIIKDSDAEAGEVPKRKSKWWPF